MDVDPPIATPSRRALMTCRVLLVALVALVFGRVLTFGYLNWDDHTTIFENPAMRPPSVATFVDAWTSPHLSLWIPVTHTFWALLALVADRGETLATWPYRLASVALHATASVFVFEIAWRLLRNRVVPAAVAAALFAFHPINVEAVAWISGQKDLLAATLTFAALFCAVRPRTGRDGSDAPAMHPAAVYAFAVAAMLAKPQAVTVVAMLPLVSVAAGDAWRRAIRAALPLVPAAVVVAIVARLAQPAALVEPASLATRPLVALDALGWYAAKIAWPATLAIDYGRASGRVSFGVAAIAGAVLCLLAARAIAARRPSLVSVGLAIAVIGVAPVLGFVPFEFQKYSTVADHYAYTSMLGVALAFAAAVAWLPWAETAFGILILACANRAFARVFDWRDTQSVMAANLSAVPTSLAALRVLAFEASRRGDDAAAVAFLRRATDAHDDGQAWFNLANALARRGMDADARAAYGRAIALRPDLSPARYNYAIFLVRTGDLDEAERQLVAAQQHDPRGGMVADALRRLRSMRATSRPAM